MVTPTFQDAVALHGEGKFKEAAAAYREVLAAGEHFGATYNLSLLYAAAGRYDEALPLATAAIRLSPESAQAQDHLGGLLVHLGRPGAAIGHFREAVRLQPNFAQACNNLGAALQAINNIAESIRWFERAIELLPEYADAHANLGTSLAMSERFEEARSHFDSVIRSNPQDPTIYEKIGSAAVMKGDLSEGMRAYARGLEIDPRRGALYRLLANAKRLPEDDPYFSAMERLGDERQTLSLDQQLELHFALGKAYMDNARYDRSISHFLSGNSIKRRFVWYDEAATIASLAGIAHAFSAEGIRALEGFGDPSRVPIFIVGMPRSGTTLVEQILASLPGVHGAGELETFPSAVAEVLPVQQKLTPETLRALGARYVRDVMAMAPDALRVTDKMPANFRFVGLIHLALPNARIIHTRRDPVDTCMSCFAQIFRGDQPFAYELAELGRYYRAYERLMDHWRRALPPGVMIEVRYEELVADLESNARRIVAHAGLDWDPACLAFYETQRTVRTASASQVRRPLYKTSVGRWRPYADLLRPLFEALEIPLEATS